VITRTATANVAGNLKLLDQRDAAVANGAKALSSPSSWRRFGWRRRGSTRALREALVPSLWALSDASCTRSSASMYEMPWSSFTTSTTWCTSARLRGDDAQPIQEFRQPARRRVRIVSEPRVRHLAYLV
jgi:hypothetical protein